MKSLCMRSARRDWYQRDVRHLERAFHRSRSDEVSGYDPWRWYGWCRCSAHKVPLLGYKAFRVKLEFGWAVVESPDQRGIPRGEQLLVGVPDFFPLGTVVFVGGGVGVILALGR